MPNQDIEPDEAAIEFTCQWLKCFVQSDHWEADPARDLWPAIRLITTSNLPESTKSLAREMLSKSHSKKPTRQYRDRALGIAASLLVSQGYFPTRNDGTTLKESASSIICEALLRLGVKMEEKTINNIILKVLKKAVLKTYLPPA
jgi:hypothetical protein